MSTISPLSPQTPQQVRGGKPLAVYIHWPFCKSKCPYCDFNSHVREKVEAQAWKSALLAELDYARTLAPDHRVVSIFFGGGTPSLMPPDIAQALIARVKELWPHEDDLEITLEANPTSVEADTFPAFKQAGVNRLSLGIQSLRPEALTFLGREHSAEEAIRAIELARMHFARYSFDLIYARPGQSLEAWREELREALALAGTHLSLYQLTIEEGTAFYTAFHKGAFTMPDEEHAAALYELTEDMTRARNLHAYEVSNYAAPGAESRHNLAYWRGEDYIGIGPGAHGRIGRDGVRHATFNLKSPERWLSQAQEKGHGLESLTPLAARTHIEERMMMGLRLLGGMPRQEVAAFLDEKKQALAIKEGLLHAHPTQLIATPKGRLVLTSLGAMLLRA